MIVRYTLLQQYMDDSNQRMEKLREQLKLANQKILSLSHGQADESKAQGNEQNEQKSNFMSDVINNS